MFLFAAFNRTMIYSNITDCPTIGNQVQIMAGAKVIGKMANGDNAKIGANAVVKKMYLPTARWWVCPLLLSDVMGIR